MKVTISPEEVINFKKTSIPLQEVETFGFAFLSKEDTLNELKQMKEKVSIEVVKKSIQEFIDAVEKSKEDYFFFQDYQKGGYRVFAPDVEVDTTFDSFIDDLKVFSTLIYKFLTLIDTQESASLGKDFIYCQIPLEAGEKISDEKLREEIINLSLTEDLELKENFNPYQLLMQLGFTIRYDCQEIEPSEY